MSRQGKKPTVSFEPPKSLTEATVAKAPTAAPVVVPPQEQAPAPAKLPDLVVLREHFGVSVNGCLRSWAAGVPITRPDDVAVLVAHNAPINKYIEV